MNILVINAGSSSVKAAVIDPATGARLLEMNAERLLDAPVIDFSDGTHLELSGKGPDRAIATCLEALKEKLADTELAGVGHRVVHGGEAFDRAVRIDAGVEEKIAGLAKLAPLHNPVNLRGIQAAQELFPAVDHFAVFDTAFHQSLPNRAKTYALPKALLAEHGIRRYGFHGTSHQYVAAVAAKHLGAETRDLRIITCHLGNGCSVAAIEFGRSVETSMGMTPLEGLAMGTRSGDVDPGLIRYLHEQAGLSPAALDELLNRQSGLAGLSGAGNDMRTILQRSTEGDPDCQLAVQVFTHRLRKYIGAYAAVMGGVDAIVFTGGIGENSPVIRHRAAQRLDFLGAIINEDKNHSAKLSDQAPVFDFSMQHSRVKLLAVRTDEQLAIARQCGQLIAQEDAVNTLPAIPIAISARHIHLRQETVEQLFGKGHELTVKKWLSQPGQFAAEELVTVVGPRNQIERVRVLGPVRSADQLEISRTDEFFLGIDAPIRESGKVENTPGCKLIGPAGTVDLEDGVICAWRHIHMTPEDAAVFGVKDRDIVEVAVGSGERSLVFGNVLIRVSPDYRLEMHIDTDEGNAAEINVGEKGVLRSTSSAGTLRKKRPGELVG
ncbi:acetate/propionate family kinase [Neolewinella lacunae]|uniref:Acetate kinase n=1 Tax=Neolewinella lacunae TaxID=1517758 RepID=A0A923PQQ7_9BACT|nr:acetate/propionate family kinase [Neolewinella lacunae]MBC6996800.1 acetate/propionate family kinase [Neolewinella lacunae]MDN3637028.1 acetate/propionate family kinase [Neolewinella lacunae]